MLRKYVLLLGMILSILLLLVAILYYPGGSRHDKHSIGYDWQNNYISNLFGNQAMNGQHNASQPWAIAAMVFLGGSFALFFIEFSANIPSKGAANIVRYFGAGGSLAAFLTVTPYHDLMVTISSTMILVCMFYIAVFAFKAKLFFAGLLSIVCLIVAYTCTFIYYSGNFEEYLPVMQKVGLATTIIWCLYLQYFTSKEGFEKGRKVGG